MKRLIVAICLVLLGKTVCATNWTQFGYDPQHDGFNSQERGYSTATGNTILYQANLPHIVDSTPIYLSGVETSLGTIDLVFIVSTDGTLMAINAADGSSVWSQQPGSFPNGQYTTSAPAIDPSLGYVYAFGLDGDIHKYSAADGTEFTGGGWPQVSTLKPGEEKVESALTIATAKDGSIHLYTVTGSNFDGGDYQGHLTTINLLPSGSSYAQIVFNGQCSEFAIHFVSGGITSGAGQNDCPKSNGNGGLWSISGATYDAGTDRVFMTTGNGPFDPSNLMGQGRDWSDSVIALNANGSSTNGQPIDSFTPSSFAALQNDDVDLGISSVVVLPTPARSLIPHLGVQIGKDGCIRLLNLQNLNHSGIAGRVGGEIQVQSMYPSFNGCSSGELIGGPRIQPAVWVNPADSTTWIYVAEQAYQLVLDIKGDPSLVEAWGQAYGSSPVVANGEVYALDDGLLILDALTGNTISSIPQGGDAGKIGSTHWAAPIVVDGKVFLVDEGSETGSSRITAVALDGIFRSNFQSP